MIKIEHPDIQKIAEKHYEACSNYVLPRLNFVVGLFDALGNNNYQSSLNLFGLTITPIRSILKSILKKSKQKTIKLDEIKSTFLTGDKSYYLSKHTKSQFKEFHNFFLEIKVSLKSILMETPFVLYDIVKDPRFNIQTQEPQKSIIESIFSYETLTGKGFKLNDRAKWDSYTLTKNLDISVCPYCNRNWIITVTGGKTKDKVVNPQLDHFFSKSDFPILRLSFYNLIPSCETCNARLKKAIEFDKDKNLHPYIEEYGENAKFKAVANTYEASIGIGSDYEIRLDYNSLTPTLNKKIKENHEIFKIDTIYKKHGDLIAELYRKKHISNDRYLQILSNTFQSLNISKEEMYRLAFGNYFDESEFKKRPLAKLTRDIAEDIGLI